MATPSQSTYYLDIDELSSRSSLSVTTLRRYVRNGRIKAIQPGGPGAKLLFLPDALERTVRSDKTLDQSNTTPSSSQPETLPGRRPGWKNRAPAQVDPSL